MEISGAGSVLSEVEGDHFEIFPQSIFIVGKPVKEFDALPVALNIFGYGDEAWVSILGEGPC